MNPSLSFTAMASPCCIVVDAPASPAVDEALARGRDEVLRIERKYSRYDPRSLTSVINRAAGGAPVVCDAETASLLNLAQHLFEQSGGLFDLTSGVLRQAWDFRRAVLPDPQQLKALRSRVGWSRVHWDGAEIALPVAGMEIDFGGLGKEYAADRVAALMAGAGVAAGLVNLGGDVRAWGQRRDARAWQVGVQHPRCAGTLALAVGLGQGGLATSGDYERYFEHAGERYCHLLDPTTGWPVQYWQSVTVVAPTCLLAGVMSTVFMLMQAQAPQAMRESGLQCWAIGPDGVLQTFGVLSSG